MPAHPPIHFFWTLAFLCVTTALMAVVRTRILRRRLVVAALAFVASSVLHIAIVQDERFPNTRQLAEQGPSLEYVLAAFGVIAALVALVLNPWRRERVGGGVPAIVQDAVVVVLSFGAALFFFQNHSFLVGVTGSAIVFGLALQDTLGNAFAGLALQVERPFRVGHWVTVAEHEGIVVEVTWRATKIRTKLGNLVVLPNSEIAKAAITNYSQPTAPFRLEVDIGLGYPTPPNESREALLVALRRVPRVLKVPAPEILLWEFGPSTLNYRIWFWTDDFENYEVVQSQVRKAIYYELGRRNIEIPYPIQVEYGREEPPVDIAGRQEEAFRSIQTVPVFAGLPEDAQRALAAATNARLFADADEIVLEGEAGGTMYIVQRGQVNVTIGHEQRRVARIGTGGYFGEMSLLTGEPRNATVTADGDCTVLEIAAADFTQYVQAHPSVLEQLAAAAVARRRELDETRSAALSAPQERQSLLQKMRKFFGIA